MRYFAFLFIVLTTIVTFPPISLASDFTNATLRLDRQKSDSPLAGLVCATPTSTATEGRFKIAFPSDFSISGSGWSTGTANIPSGSTAWPGITFNSTSGTTAIFTSNDVTAGTRYCFTFTASGSTTGSAGDKSGTVTTHTAGDTIIDTKAYGVTIQSNDQVTVSGSIAANPADFEAELTTTSADATVSQNTTLTYTLTYGSNLSSPTNITVEADWSLGTISGSGSPSVDILDYVVGSASDGYSSTPPVIDTVNRTISWEISSFPGNTTGETVTFQMKTNTNYTGSSTVSFSVNGRVVGNSTQSPDSTVTKNYQYTTSSSSSTNTPSSTPTPTPLSVSFNFGNLSVERLSESTATISVETSSPSTLRIRYGTSPSNLNQIISTSDFSSSQTVEIPNLNSNETYYFTVTATNAAGTRITSDIFTFTTAASSENIPQLKRESIILTSASTILNKTINPGENETVYVVLPTVQPYEFRFELSNHETVRRVSATIKNESVLGINNITSPSLTQGDIEVFEMSPGIYLGRLQTPITPGIYALVIRVHDFSGNITEQKVGTIKVAKPFGVYKKRDKTPIENVRIILSFYNPTTHIFKVIPPQHIPIKNPSFTEPDGTIRYSLPNGKYKAEIIALGYQGKTIEFTLGEREGEEFPQVYLDEELFNVLTLASYYLSSIRDIYHATQAFIYNLSESTRFFDLIAMASMLCFALTALILLRMKTHISLSHMPHFFLYHMKQHMKKNQNAITGEVYDEDVKKAITKTKISLTDQDTGRILSTTYTNKLGEFILKVKAAKQYVLTIEKTGYKKEVMSDFNPNTSFPIHIGLSLEGTTKNGPFHTLISGLENVLGFCFELFLFISILFEFIFLQTIEPYKTLPFIVVSIFTLFIWFFYVKRGIKKSYFPNLQ